MSLIQGIVKYFVKNEELGPGWDALAPKYYSFQLDEAFKNTQLVLAAADGGVIVALVNGQKSWSEYVLEDSSAEAVRTQLDAFVRQFHTETAVHHRKLSNPTPASEKVAVNFKRPSDLSPLTTLAPGDAGLHKPVFEDDHDLASTELSSRGNIAIGQRDLDPLGIRGDGSIEFPPAPGGPSIGPGGRINLPSQGGMHPTPWGSNARYDPPGPTSSFNNMP